MQMSVTHMTNYTPTILSRLLSDNLISPNCHPFSPHILFVLTIFVGTLSTSTSSTRKPAGNQVAVRIIDPVYPPVKRGCLLHEPGEIAGHRSVTLQRVFEVHRENPANQKMQASL